MVSIKSLANLRPCSSTHQPKHRTPRGKSPTTYLELLMKHKIDALSPIDGKKKKLSGAEIIAIKLFIKATQDDDLGALKEIFDRIDGKQKEILLDQSQHTHSVVFESLVAKSDEAPSRIAEYADSDKKE